MMRPALCIYVSNINKTLGECLHAYPWNKYEGFFYLFIFFVAIYHLLPLSVVSWEWREVGNSCCSCRSDVLQNKCFCLLEEQHLLFLWPCFCWISSCNVILQFTGLHENWVQSWRWDVLKCNLNGNLPAVGIWGISFQSHHLFCPNLAVYWCSWSVPLS